MQRELDQLLQKRVDRKEFLTHIGAAALAMVGIGGIVKVLTDPKGNATKPVRPPHYIPITKNESSTRSGYGSSKYGV